MDVMPPKWQCPHCFVSIGAIYALAIKAHLEFVHAIREDADGEPLRAAPVSGGYYDLGKHRYWIDEPLYSEVVERDNTSAMTRKGDREFGGWLKGFLKEHDIQPSANQARSSSIAGYWAMPYSDKSGIGGLLAKHASVLRSVRTVVSVVDPMHKLSVNFEESATTSSWDSKKDRIYIPSKPVREITDLEDCINVQSGFAVHEAWHSEYTRPLLAGGDAVDYLAVSQWNILLANLLEDIRIEDEGLKETPGYREQLDYTAEFLWDGEGVAKVKTWPADPEGRAPVAISVLRYEDRVEETLTDPSFVEPSEWLRGWASRYLAEQSPVATWDVLRSFVEEGKSFLGVMPSTPAPSNSVTKMTPCGYTDDDRGVSRADVDDIEKAIEAELETYGDPSKMIDKSLMPPSGKHRDGASMDGFVVLKPLPFGKFRSHSSGLIEKAKAALLLKKTRPSNDTRMMRSGELDEDELYRYAANDMRIFKDSTESAIVDATVYLLVDCSASMGDWKGPGSPAYHSTQIAQVFAQALARHSNVSVKVLGHSGQNADNTRGGAFYRIWEKGDPLDRLTSFGTIRYSQNFDGWAIAWAGTMLLKDPAQQKLLIVLSDGIPGATGYGGDSAMDHVRFVTDQLDRKGISVVQVALCGELRESDQDRMFKHFISAPADESSLMPIILRKLTVMLRRLM